MISRFATRRSAFQPFCLSAILLPFCLSAVLQADDITREEALALAYPGASIRAERVFLTSDQRRRASSLAGEEIPTSLVGRYVATVGAEPAGRAYVDTNVVRTKKETLLISLDPRGLVRRVDVTAFLEPPEYRPPAPWLGQYTGRPFDEGLRLNRTIRPIAGATLTARAVSSALRRILAVDTVLQSGGTR